MMLKMLKAPNPTPSGSNLGGCGLCGINKKPFKILSKNSTDSDDDRTEFVEDLREKVICMTLLASFT